MQARHEVLKWLTVIVLSGSSLGWAIENEDSDVDPLGALQPQKIFEFNDSLDAYF